MRTTKPGQSGGSVLDPSRSCLSSGLADLRADPIKFNIGANEFVSYINILFLEWAIVLRIHIVASVFAIMQLKRFSIQEVSFPRQVPRLGSRALDSQLCFFLR